MRLAWLTTLSFLFPVAGTGYGAFQPPPNCMVGFYRVSADKVSAADPCAGLKPCPRGSYCSAGTKLPCPAGSYGNTSSLTSPVCSGPCPPGFFCPPGTADPLPCTRADSYCPAGSAAPQPVSPGFYSDPSRSRQSICPPGSFCIAGMELPCPSGTFGASPGLSTNTCSGPCPAGFYCPVGTTAYARFSCGVAPTHYCPEGAPRQYATDVGHYAVNSTILQGGGYSAQLPCLPGTYCANGVSHSCPAGFFGSNMLEVRRSNDLAAYFIIVQTNPSCSGRCNAGYFCPQGSFSSRQLPCGDIGHFCPEGSGAPIKAMPGHYTLSMLGNTDISSAQTRSSQAVCEPGFYCVGGLRLPCPAGTYGASVGLTTSKCSGLCEAGYFCPEGSSSPSENECGSPSVICPVGSGSPRAVQTGYYSGMKLRV